LAEEIERCCLSLIRGLSREFFPYHLKYEKELCDNLKMGSGISSALLWFLWLKDTVLRWGHGGVLRLRIGTGNGSTNEAVFRVDGHRD